ncbi:hypothetical protein N9H94_03540, partial [Akkermansiaceae bacterium]|nr:hypothetical protein [Akkermansiaceae bacterium]
PVSLVVVLENGKLAGRFRIDSIWAALIFAECYSDLLHLVNELRFTSIFFALITAGAARNTAKDMMYPSMIPARAIPPPPRVPPDAFTRERAMWPVMIAGIPVMKQKTKPRRPRIKLAIAKPEVPILTGGAEGV